MKHLRRGSLRAALVTSVAVSALLLAGCSSTSSSNGSDSAGSGSTAAADGAWSYKDATGTTVKVDHTPKRVVVLNDIAISFVEYGLKPVGTFGQLTMAKDARFDDLDTDGITQLGEAYGDIDLEELAALKPDLVVTSVYPTDAKGTLDETQPVLDERDGDVVEDDDALRGAVGLHGRAGGVLVRPGTGGGRARARGVAGAGFVVRTGAAGEEEGRDGHGGHEGGSEGAAAEDLHVRRA